MINREELKQKAKQQISGKIGILFLCTIIAGLVGGIIPLILTAPISIGMAMIYLNVTKGKKPEVVDVFKGFDIFGQSILLVILISVFTMLWSLLLVIPGIIKGLSYSMAPYVLAENPEMTALEALNRSKQIMSGHKMDLFVLYLSFIGWALLGCITFGLVYIYVGPYMQATTANFYNQIKQPE